MTYEEALDECIYRVLEGDEKEVDLFYMCMNALKKQMPKLVKNKGYLGRINAQNIYYGECPACGKAVGSASCKKWCDQCGQLLEWG